MSHQCSSGSCSHNSHHHGHDASSCGCCCHRECHCPCHESHHQKYSEQLLELADEAWMELVKDKIKEEILKYSNEHITQLAQLVSKANHARWKEKLTEKGNLEDYAEQLYNLITKHHQ